MERVLLTPIIGSGEKGFCAKVTALEIEFHAPTEEEAVSGLRSMTREHCRKAISPGNTIDATPAQLKLAQAIVFRGFDFVGD